MTCEPMIPPMNGVLSGNSRIVRVVCNSGYSFDPSLPYPGQFYCLRGSFGMYVNRIWTAFSKVPDCVGKVSRISAVSFSVMGPV